VRLASLDAFRGFTIAAMVLVNNPGDWSHLYAQLEHAKWNGWTFTDYIFPFFLFIGGVAMGLSLGRMAAAGADKPRLLAKLARRAALIFLIGFLLNLIPYFNFEKVCIPGVLQRIALCSQLFGVLAGRWLASGVDRLEQTVWLLLAGLACLGLGSIFDTILMPINKSLWTPSYCLLMTGWAAIAFSLFYWLLDVNPYPALRKAAARWTRPFVIYGMNALFIFAFSGFVAKMLGYVKFVQPDGSLRSLGKALYAPIAALPIGPVNTSLLHALLFEACMFAVAWVMWRNKWFVKV
jgi:predicted acyltransferase